MGAVHSLRVESPYQLLKIEDIKIENKANEHGYLYLKALIDDSINFQSTINASTDDKICVYEELEDKNVIAGSQENPVDINVVNKANSNMLFSGIVQNIRTSNVNGIYYLEIQALTISFELDIKEKSRSFQNADMTYDELIGEILKDYSTKNFAQCTGNGEKIGKSLFQIKETDWNFLKRIASELKSELYCDIIDIRNMFYFGRPSNGSHEIEDVTNYKAHKNLKRFHEAGGYEEGYHDIDYFYYEVERREKYQIGDDIWIKDKKLYVNQYSAYALKDEVIYKYRLCRKNGVWQTKMYNSLLGGSSIEGKVLAVDGEKVKLHLNIDETQNEDEASWFPYAPPTGNVMYSMPIVGTSARLYFPNEESEDPIVTGCVRTNGSSCVKTSDTTKRYFGTEHGSEIEMTPGAVNIKGGSKQPLSISFDDSTGVTLKSPKNLNLNADNEIIIKTPASVRVKAQSQIGVTKTGSENGFSVETDMHFKGGNVIKDGSDRETYAPFDDEPKAGTKPEPPAPPPEEKKGFNWGGLLVAAVAVVAVVAVVATCGVGAVLLGAAIGAGIGAACAVVSTAVSDKMNGTHSSFGTYLENALKGALTGAVSGAIFGPFGGFSSVGGVMAFGGINGMADSLLNQAIDGKFSLGQTLLDGLIGMATAGLLHGVGKIISKVSPYITKSIGKVLDKLSGEAKSILNKVSGKADDILSAFSKTGRELFDKAANKVDNLITNIKNSAQDLVDRAANKFNEVTTRIDNKIQDAFDYVKRPVDKFLIENESTLQKLAKGLDDTFAPRRAVVASNGKPYTISESSTKFQDCVSKMAGKAKDNLEKSLSPAERAAKKGFSNIGTTENGGPDFSKSKYIMKNENGDPIIATIEMSGSRSKDFTRAFEDVNIPASEREDILKNYTWHHVDDYDEATGKCTMQLVKKDAHRATYPHKGSCAQYDSRHGETYNKKYKGKTPKEKAADKGFEINETENGGADFSNTDYVYKTDLGQEASIKIKMSGSKSQDRKMLFDNLGISKEKQKELLKKNSVFYLDDFDPDTGECTIQLVDRKAYDVVKNYAGAQAQYKANTNIKYK